MVCLFGRLKKRHTRQDPLVGVGLLALHLEVRRKHVRRSAHARHVDWALVVSEFRHLCLLHGLNVHDRKFRMQVLELLVR